jgi:hypothetical protein
MSTECKLGHVSRSDNNSASGSKASNHGCIANGRIFVFKRYGARRRHTPLDVEKVL